MENPTTARATTNETQPTPPSKTTLLEEAKALDVDPIALIPRYEPPVSQPLSQIIEEEKQNRALIKNYIDEMLVKDVDYIRIHISKKCQSKWGCKNDGHFSKASLSKSGSEKFTSLFHLRPVFTKDQDTLDMMGSQTGLFCFLCNLIDKSGQTVAEGRGACSVAEKQGNINSAIKIAQKRAQVDAVLRHGALSDFFTQDIEDMNIATPKAKPPSGNEFKQEIVMQCQQLGIKDADKTADGYKDFVYQVTNLILVEKNFRQIIEELDKKIKEHNDNIFDEIDA